MTIFDSATSVIKSPAKIFGLGLAPERPAKAYGFTQADRDWASVELNRTTRQFETVGHTDDDLDRLAGISAHLDLIGA